MDNMDWKTVTILVAATVLAVSGYVAGAGFVTTAEHNPQRERARADNAARNGNDQLAFGLYTSLAKQGDASAEYRLGDMYQYGIGTNANPRHAIAWLTKAAKAGNLNASRQLGLLYLDGNVAVQDFAKARKWLTTAAGAGDMTALRSLGDMNDHGLGGPADPVAAYADYAAAVIRGNGSGAVMRDRLEKTLTADQQKRGQEKARQILAQSGGVSSPAMKTAAADLPQPGTRAGKHVRRR